MNICQVTGKMKMDSEWMNRDRYYMNFWPESKMDSGWMKKREVLYEFLTWAKDGLRMNEKGEVLYEFLTLAKDRLRMNEKGEVLEEFLTWAINFIVNVGHTQTAMVKLLSFPHWRWPPLSCFEQRHRCSRHTLNTDCEFICKQKQQHSGWTEYSIFYFYVEIVFFLMAI